MLFLGGEMNCLSKGSSAEVDSGGWLNSAIGNSRFDGVAAYASNLGVDLLCSSPSA